MFITVLAYKSNSSDSCMGCTVARFSSDFQWKTSEDRAEIEKFLAGILFSNKRMERGESEYELTILFDGQDYWDNYDLDQMKDSIESAARKTADARELDYQRKKWVAEEEKKKKAQAAQEQNERQQLATLQAKYKV